MVATQIDNMVATQHGSNTTWQHHNMVAAQNMIQTLLGTDKKVETTIHHASVHVVGHWT